jgi:hypothetical protein
VWTIERSAIGDPPNGSALTKPYADTHGSFSVFGGGLYYVGYIDRAPDVSNGADYILGGSC